MMVLAVEGIDSLHYNPEDEPTSARYGFRAARNFRLASWERRPDSAKGSKYPMFEASGSKDHAFSGFGKRKLQT